MLDLTKTPWMKGSTWGGWWRDEPWKQPADNFSRPKMTLPAGDWEDLVRKGVIISMRPDVIIDDWNPEPIYSDSNKPLPTPGEQPFQFNYPWQWNLASDIYSQLAGGIQLPTPWQWTYGSNVLRGIAKTGLPVSQEPWYQRAKEVADIDIENAIANAAEQAGLTGLRWSTPLARTAQDVSGKIMARTGLEREARELAALEAARQRQLSALGQLFTYGQGQAGLTQAALQAQLQALSGLTGLGGMYAQLPLQVSDQMMRQALIQQQLQMNQMFPPWMQGMLGLLGSQPGYAPQMYQPSFLTQLMGIVPSVLPWLLGNNQTTTQLTTTQLPSSNSTWYLPYFTPPAYGG